MREQAEMVREFVYLFGSADTVDFKSAKKGNVPTTFSECCVDAVLVEHVLPAICGGTTNFWWPRASESQSACL